MRWRHFSKYFSSTVRIREQLPIERWWTRSVGRPSRTSLRTWRVRVRSSWSAAALLCVRWCKTCSWLSSSWNRKTDCYGECSNKLDHFNFKQWLFYLQNGLAFWYISSKKLFCTGRRAPPWACPARTAGWPWPTRCRRHRKPKKLKVIFLRYGKYK